jgi:hypothetical protein
MKKQIAIAALAATLIASRAQDSTITLRCGIRVNNVSASTCLDLDPAQVCWVRFDHQHALTVIVSTESTYHAWQDGQPIDF